MSAAPAKTRVCFILPSLAPGGTERQVLYLIKGLRETHACSVICTRTGGAWAEAARADGAEILELRTWGGWDFRIGNRVRVALRSVQPQIVQTFLFGLDLPANRAARAADVPVVVSSRRELAAWMKPRHLRAQRRANALVNCIVANSQAAARFAERQEGLETGQIRVICNGIDAESFTAASDSANTRARLGIPSGKRVVGMIANFSPVKDHDLFLRAAKFLIQRHPDIHCLLVGSGPMHERIARAIREYAMQEQFTITSSTTDSAALLNAMDVCVLTSLREGSPNVVLEAMALGRPVVAAAVGGVPELVEDGVSGLLVATREPADFVAAILRLVEDEPLARELGAGARARVRREFSVDRMVQSYRALYGELLTRAGDAT